jgi:hypothetical protein
MEKVIATAVLTLLLAGATCAQDVRYFPSLALDRDQAPLAVSFTKSAETLARAAKSESVERKENLYAHLTSHGA